MPWGHPVRSGGSAGLGGVRPVPGVAVGVIGRGPGRSGGWCPWVRGVWSGRVNPYAAGRPAAGERLDGLLRASGPIGARQDPPAGSGAGPAWSSARRMISTWSALVLRPGVSGTQHERRALRLLRCRCRGRTMRSGGAVTEPLLERVGAVSSISPSGRPPEWRRCRSPAAGPPRRRRPVSARRPGPTPAVSLSCGPGLGGLGGLDAVGQGPHQP